MTHSQMREWESSVSDSFESVGVWERERDKGKNRGSFGNLPKGGGAGQPQTFVKVSQMFVYKYSQTDHISSFFFFFFWDKNIKVFKNRYVIKFEFFINRNSNNKR